MSKGAGKKQKHRGGGAEPAAASAEERRFESLSDEEDPYDLSDLERKPSLSPNLRALIAVLMLLVVCYVGYQVRQDLLYLFAGFTPAPVAKVGDIFESGDLSRLEHNSYAHVVGLPRWPPYTYTLDADPTPPHLNPEGTHMRMWRLSRTDSRFYVVQEVSNAVPPNWMETEFAGRLIAVDQYPNFLANLRKGWTSFAGEDWKPGTWVLFAGEAPQTQYMHWAVLLFLALVLPLNAWSLWGWWRARKEPSPATRA